MMTSGDVVGVIHVVRILAVPFVVGVVGTAIDMTIVPVAMAAVPSFTTPPALIPVVAPP
jgi:hypothetical protein